MAKRKKKLAFSLIVFLVLSIMLSCSYVSENHNHECIGENCTVCYALKSAEDLFSGAKKIVVLSLSFLFSFFAVLVLISKKQHFFGFSTPVSLKDIIIN